MGRTNRRLKWQQEPEPGIVIREDDLALAQYAAALCCAFLEDEEYIQVKVLGHKYAGADPPEKFVRIEMIGTYRSYRPYGLQYFHVAQEALRLYAESAENGYEPRHRADV